MTHLSLYHRTPIKTTTFKTYMCNLNYCPLSQPTPSTLRRFQYFLRLCSTDLRGQLLSMPLVCSICLKLALCYHGNVCVCFSTNEHCWYSLKCEFPQLNPLLLRTHHFCVYVVYLRQSGEYIKPNKSRGPEKLQPGATAEVSK